MRGNLLYLQTQSIVRAEIGVTSLTYVALAVGMKSTKVQTLGRNIGTFGLETPICMHMY